MVTASLAWDHNKQLAEELTCRLKISKLKNFRSNSVLERCVEHTKLSVKRPAIRWHECATGALRDLRSGKIFR